MEVEIILPNAFEGLQSLPFGPACGGPSMAELQLSRPDAHLVLKDAGIVTARCSVWCEDVPDVEGCRTGLIGHFSAEAEESALRLVSRSCDYLEANQCVRVIAPVDGSTWMSYRFVVEPGERPPFFLEPWNPPEYPEYFRQCGFAPWAYYQSSLVFNLNRIHPHLDSARNRLHAEGVGIRPFDPKEFDKEVERIHRISLVAFSNNPLYREVSLPFLRLLYEPFRTHIDPRFSFIAEDGELPVGFVFAIPDLLEYRRTGAAKTLVAKTLAVMPGRRYAGLGICLLEEVHQAARCAGFSAIIHALEYARNPVRNLSGKYGEIMRGYALFSRELSPPESSGR